MVEETNTTRRASTASGPTARPGRAMNVVLWVLQVLLALFFGIVSAFPKLTAHSSATEFFDQVGFGDWFMYLVGALELAGAIALLIPILAGLASVAFVGLMVGAAITTVVAFGGENIATPLILIVVFCFLAWGRRASLTRLFSLLAGRG